MFKLSLNQSVTFLCMGLLWRVKISISLSIILRLFQRLHLSLFSPLTSWRFGHTKKSRHCYSIFYHIYPHIVRTKNVWRWLIIILSSSRANSNGSLEILFICLLEWWKHPKMKWRLESVTAFLVIHFDY